MKKTDKKYPIYEFRARLNQDDYQGNFVSANVMFKEKPTNGELTDRLIKWWGDFLVAPRTSGKPIGGLHPELLELTLVFKGNGAWVLKWFCHTTYNLFGSQEEAFASFHRFVIEKMPLQHNLELPKEYTDKHKLKTYCLMGAEDTWRWKLCGCDKCKEAGITAILH